MLLAPFLWIFCEFDEKVLDNLSLEKLDDDSYGLRHIQTVWGAGYRFHVGK